MIQMSEGFNYSYSANRQAEIDRIKAKYMPEKKSEEENKLERLRKLDASCESVAQTAGLVLGIVGTLVFGVAMTCFLVWGQYLLGSLAAVIGIPMIVMAKPVYDKVLRERRAKAAPEILRLTRELENGEG